MSLRELFILAVGLAMDAFAVSVCKGLSVRKAGVKECCIAGLYFGGCQALMPAIGYLDVYKRQRLRLPWMIPTWDALRNTCTS